MLLATAAIILAGKLQPTWLVLRPVEIAEQKLNEGETLTAYQMVGYWNQWPQIRAIDFLPGRNWLGFDSQFFVFQRIDAATSTAGRIH